MPDAVLSGISLPRRLRRISLAAAAVAGALVTCAALVVVDVRGDAALKQAQSRELAALAGGLAHDAAGAAQARDRLAQMRPPDAQVLLFDAAGRLVASAPQLSDTRAAGMLSPVPGAQAPSTIIESVPGLGRVCVANVPVRLDDQSSGTLYLVRRAPHHAAETGAWLPIVLVGLASVGLTRLWIVRHWRRHWQGPIAHVSAIARAISERAPLPEPLPRADDEFGALDRALRRVHQRTTERVRNAEDRCAALETLLDNLRDGVLVVHGAGRVALLNAAAAELLQLNPNGATRAFRGAPIERLIHEHDLQHMLTAPLAELTGPGPDAPDAGNTAETRVVVEGPDGARHLQIHACDVTWCAAGERGAATTGPARLLVLSDVTSVTRALQVRTDFVANASHELRTPLATIRAAVEMLGQPDVESDVTALREYVSIIDRQSARLAALARDLLDLANLEDPGKRVEPRVVPLSELLGDLRLHFADALARRNLRLESVIVDTAPPRVLVSPLLLRLALDNLIDNAIKFSERGDVVELHVSGTASSVQFEVRDHGCGIPLEEQERIFERFYQVERARSGRERGTGLGLSIVRNAVTAMGGTVSLESTPDQGTCVRIALPRGPERSLTDS